MEDVAKPAKSSANSKSVVKGDENLFKKQITKHKKTSSLTEDYIKRRSEAQVKKEVPVDNKEKGVEDEKKENKFAVRNDGENSEQKGNNVPELVVNDWRSTLAGSNKKFTEWEKTQPTEGCAVRRHKVKVTFYKLMNLSHFCRLYTRLTKHLGLGLIWRKEMG